MLVMQKNLPPKMYPEYHKVHKMMAGEVVSPGYSAMEETEIVNISSDGIITTQKENSRGNDNTFKVCL